jgi:hypothetical protein
VLDAARTALIPLRPLTIGEILDGAFLIVRRNASLMLGLPLVVAGGTALYLLAGIGLWVLLGNTTVEGAQIVLVVLMALFGLLLLVQCLSWMTAILSRVSLQTVLGEGFAPAEAKLNLRAAGSLFWPIFGLSCLQYVATSAIQTVTGILYYLLLGVFAVSGADEVTAIVAVLVVNLISLAILSAAYGYISLTVPAFAVESARAPGWIGKPAKATTVITSFERSIKLVGLRNAPRVALVYLATAAICLSVIFVLSVGMYLLVLLFAGSVNVDVTEVLLSPWTTIGVVGFAVVVAMSALLAYVAAVQVLLYLDLRMRREALDLALRFDCVPVPQPSAPPPVWGLYPPVGPPALHPALPPVPTVPTVPPPYPAPPDPPLPYLSPPYPPSSGPRP